MKFHIISIMVLFGVCHSGVAPNFYEKKFAVESACYSTGARCIKKGLFLGPATFCSGTACKYKGSVKVLYETNIDSYINMLPLIDADTQYIYDSTAEPGVLSAFPDRITGEMIDRVSGELTWHGAIDSRAVTKVVFNNAPVVRVKKIEYKNDMACWCINK